MRSQGTYFYTKQKDTQKVSAYSFTADQLPEPVDGGVVDRRQVGLALNAEEEVALLLGVELGAEGRRRDAVGLGVLVLVHSARLGIKLL